MEKDPVIERINAVLSFEKITREELCRATDIGYSRWTNVLQGKAKLRHDEIIAFGKAYPEYKHWIAFDEELPEAGQISPMTKAAQKELGTQRKA